MENQLATFNFGDQPVRMINLDGEPWWVAKDVCDALGIQNSRDALAKVLDDDEKGVATIYTPGAPQEMGTVNESGLYTLVLRSRKPEAKQFKRWITHEVLPSIRRTGSYTTPNVPVQPARIGAVGEMLARLEALETKVRTLEAAPALPARKEPPTRDPDAPHPKAVEMLKVLRTRGRLTSDHLARLTKQGERSSEFRIRRKELVDAGLAFYPSRGYIEPVILDKAPAIAAPIAPVTVELPPRVLSLLERLDAPPEPPAKKLPEIKTFDDWVNHRVQLSRNTKTIFSQVFEDAREHLPRMFSNDYRGMKKLADMLDGIYGVTVWCGGKGSKDLHTPRGIEGMRLKAK